MAARAREVAKRLLYLDFLCRHFDKKQPKYYHCAFMSAPAVIDSLEFARGGETLRGTLAVERLTRLHDELLDTSGGIDFRLSGGQDARSRYILRLSLKGHLQLRCQRCLGPLGFAVELANTLVLVEPGKTPDGFDDPEEPECIEASRELDVASLVEDEILLGLPYAPKHAEGQCERRTGDAGKLAAASPFAALAALKKTRSTRR